MGNKPTIAISHLGCEKNRIDSEHMLGLLAKAGYPVDNDEELADYVIVNTCSFIQAAREESVRTLVELAEANKKIIISGCMAQHFQDELLTELPEAVAIVGTGDYQKIVEIVERVETGERVKEVSADPTFIADENLPRYRTTTEGVAICGWPKAVTIAVPSVLFPTCAAIKDPVRSSPLWPKRDNWPAKACKN